MKAQKWWAYKWNGNNITAVWVTFVCRFIGVNTITKLNQYSFTLIVLDQHTKTWRKPPKSDIFPHPNSTLQKWARQKSCRLIHSHVKTIVKKMHGELLPPPNHPSNPLQPPLVEVWIAGKENGDRQTDKVFCRPTPWVWQKCMENSGGTTFRWPVKLLRESNPTPNVCVC